MKLHHAPPDLSVNEKLEYTKKVVTPLKIRTVLIAVFALIFFCFFKIMHEETQVPVYVLMMSLPKYLFTHTGAILEYTAEAVGFSGIIFSVIHVAIASFWKHNRNSYTRRKIIFNWALLLILLQIIFSFTS